ncbi:DUF4116 domain-containing protein [Corticibacter populi]|nr:DUF4116 domain-containing protein [Corticibacter populi]RZS30112.1 uncharacterized protein DUF4116 [Corticibacter populi]
MTEDSSNQGIPASREQALQAVRQGGYWLALLPVPWRDDETIVQEAVAHTGMALEYASPRLRGSKPVVLAAVAQDGLALSVADPSLCADPDVLRSAARSNFLVYGFASRELRADQDFMVDLFRNVVRPQILCGFMPEEVPQLLDEALQQRRRDRMAFFQQLHVPEPS